MSRGVNDIDGFDQTSLTILISRAPLECSLAVKRPTKYTLFMTKGDNFATTWRALFMPRFLFPIIAVCCIFAALACNAVTAAVAIPDPVIDAPLATAKGQQTAVIAGGCFWGIQNLFEHVKGVTVATSGYSGVEANTAEYEMVSTG